MLVHGTCECFVMQMLQVCLVCILWQSLMLVEDARGDNMEGAYAGAGLMTAL